jgi:hypothetical protein
MNPMERNPTIYRTAERTYNTLHRHIRRSGADLELRKAMRAYAANEVESKVYSMFKVPVKKNPRYKGMQGTT